MLVTLLAGRAAELAVYGDCSIGAVDDVDRAAKLARNYVVDFAMSDLGAAARAAAPADCDAAVARVLRTAEQDATALATREKAALLVLADALLEKGALDRAGLVAVLGEPQEAPPNHPLPL